MKKIVLIFSCFIILLSGCSSKTKEYVRDTSPGEIKEISLNEMKTKQKNKDNFLVIVTQSGCGHCETLKEMLNKYLEKHHVLVYEVNVKNEDNPQEAYNYFKDKYEDFLGTPATIVFSEGVADSFMSGEVEKKDFNNLVKEFQLDKKIKD